MNGIDFFIPHNLSNALGWMVLHVLWQAGVIGVEAGFLLAALRRRPARYRYWAANTALAAILIAALGTFVYYYDDAAPSPAGGHAAPEAHAPALLKTDAIIHPAVATPALSGVVVSEYFNRRLPLVAAVWFLGMSLFLLRLTGNIWYVYYLKTRLNFPADPYWQDMLDQLAKKSGLRKTARLVESALVRTPMVLGYFKPLILFPVGMINRLDPREAEAILAHELAHILRHDYLFNILQSVVEALFYFHPAVWWLSGVARHEREVAADDMAVRLTGNPMTYAKTLVLVQDAAFVPVSLSPAFSGARKNRLLERVQHVLNVQQSKSLAMEKIIVTCCILLVIIGIGYTQTGNTTTTVTERPVQSAPPGDGRSGVWQGTIENDRVCMTLASRSDNSSWMNGACFATSEFSALPVAEADFTVTREAGTITFRGKFEGKEGYGRFTFAPDRAFSGWLDQQGISGLDDNMLMHLFFANTGKEYVAFLKKSGYGEINAEELSRLSIHEVSQKDLTDYQEIAKEFGGSRLSIDDLIDLKIHGIDRDYIATLHKSGFPNLPLDNIRDAKIQEIDPEFIRRCRDMGFPNLSFDEIMNFKIHEVTPEYIRECRDMGFPNLNADEVLNFKIHGMNLEYLKGLKDAGLTSLSADEALNMRIHEVTPAAIAEFRKMGFEKLTSDDIINLRIHEINPVFLSDMQNLGFKDLSTDDAVNLRVHGIDRAFVQELGRAGFSGLSVDDAVNCKIHEVNPASIREFNDLGFSKISVDDAVNLRIHEVTPAFIRLMREKGFKNLSLEEYIGLKVQYGDKMNK